MRQHWRKAGYSISEVRMGNLQVAEEEWNARGREIPARQLRSKGHKERAGVSSFICLESS